MYKYRDKRKGPFLVAPHSPNLISPSSGSSPSSAASTTYWVDECILGSVPFSMFLSNHDGFTPWLLEGSTHKAAEGIIQVETGWAQGAFLHWSYENYNFPLDSAFNPIGCLMIKSYESESEYISKSYDHFVIGAVISVSLWARRDMGIHQHNDQRFPLSPHSANTGYYASKWQCLELKLWNIQLFDRFPCFENHEWRVSNCLDWETSLFVLWKGDQGK